jgi:hypothetical protein
MSCKQKRQEISAPPSSSSSGGFGGGYNLNQRRHRVAEDSGKNISSSSTASSSSSSPTSIAGKAMMMMMARHDRPSPNNNHYTNGIDISGGSTPMTASPNYNSHRLQHYYPLPPPPYRPQLSSPTTTTIIARESPPPPPQRSIGSQKQAWTPPPPPPPPPVRHRDPTIRRRSSSCSSSKDTTHATSEVSSIVLSSSLLCGVINDTNSNSSNHNLNSKKKEVTFSSSTIGGMAAATTTNGIGTLAVTTADNTAYKNKNNKPTNNGSPATMPVEEQIRMKPPAHNTALDIKNTFTMATMSISGNNNDSIHHGKNATSASQNSSPDSDLLKRVSTVCDSVYAYLKEFDSRNNASTNNTHSPSSSVYSSNTGYSRRHTMDTVPIKTISSSASKMEDHVNSKMVHEKRKGVSFTESTSGYYRRHSTGNNMTTMSPMPTADTTTTSVQSIATKTHDRVNTPTITTSTPQVSRSAENRYDRSQVNPLVPPQDLSSSSPSVVRGRQRSRMQSYSTIAAAPTSSATTQQQTVQQQQQQQRHNPRSTSVDNSARGQHSTHRRSSSRKAIIDDLTEQVNNNSSSRSRTASCRSFRRSSSEDVVDSGDGIRMNSLFATKTLLQQLRTSLDDVVAARRGSGHRKENLAPHKLGTSTCTSTPTPTGQRKIRSFSKNGDEVVAEWLVADDNKDAIVVDQQEQSRKKKIHSKSSPSHSSSATGGSTPKSEAVGSRRRNTCTSTDSLSATETGSDCESLISVLRSYRGGERKRSGSVCDRKMGRKLNAVGGVVPRHHAHRRRGSSLSRSAERMLSTMNSPGRDNVEDSGSNAMEDDSKANMVYDIPFDPITGKCHHHSTVQMAVRDDDDNMKKGASNGDSISLATTTTDSAVIFGWRIVRTICPKCKYNY